jgi:cytochrome c-type biogenesis protein CcmH
MKKLLLLLIWMSLLTPCLAADDVYHFETPIEQQRFDTLTRELRCLVCQNQNLAESNAGLANDLRNQIYQQIHAGQSDQDIVAYLVGRYGDFILYRPPFSLSTLGLWFGPVLVLILGVGYLIYYLRRSAKQARWE